jgi:putative hemolysin
VIQILWLVFFVLLGLDLAFVAVRSSLVSVRLAHLMTMREQRPEVVERTIELLENPRLRVMLRIVVVSLHFLLAGVIYLPWHNLRPDLDSLPIALGVLFIAALFALILELFIEGRMMANDEQWAIRLTPVGRFLNFLFTPLSALLMVFLGSLPATPFSIPVNEDELKNWVEEEHKEGTLEKGERRMIYSIFQFGETLCREIMVPRIDVLALEINTPLEEAIQALTVSGHSRVPVYEGSIDNVIGVLYAKDLLRVKLDAPNLASLRSLLRAPYFVPEAKKVEVLLSEMRANGVHISIVVDEYGGMAGLVTLEDIVEEIVGEIRDEYDQAEEVLYQQIDPDEYVFQGRIDLDDFNEIMDTHLVKDVADTLGGYISAQVGHIPTGGEQLQIDQWLLTVEQVSGRRIRKVRVRRQPAPAEMEENGTNLER